MLNRLRLYFKDFFNEFGCNLWMANILLTLPLTFRAFFDAMRYDTKWSYFWNLQVKEGQDEQDMYKLATYNVLLFFLATYIPMLFQISSLVFGFVRHKKVKIFKSFNERDQTGSSKDYKDVNDGDEDTRYNQSEYSDETDNKS